MYDNIPTQHIQYNIHVIKVIQEDRVWLRNRSMLSNVEPFSTLLYKSKVGVECAETKAGSVWHEAKQLSFSFSSWCCSLEYFRLFTTSRHNHIFLFPRPGFLGKLKSLAGILCSGLNLNVLFCRSPVLLSALTQGPEVYAAPSSALIWLSSF